MATKNWRDPKHCQKYGLHPVPEDFEPTEEEDLLIDMYDHIRHVERVAQRLKTEAALEKLAAKDAAFQQSKQTATKRRRKKKRERNLDDVQVNDDDDDDDEEEEDISSEEEEEMDQEDLHQRREEKLQQMREEVNQAKQAEEEQAKLIADHLATEGADDTDEVAILKRRRIDESENPKSSLIANITASATPPHDFSKSLELTPARGRTLFPTEPGQIKWTPPEGVFSPNDGAFSVDLENFDPNKLNSPSSNNTLAIKFQAPADAKRFSLNIASTADRDTFESVLFHFNPRQHERGGQLVVNDKNDGIWGQAIAIPLSQVPLLFGQTACTLIIQVHGDGFDIFLEGKHCARLEHRQELPSSNLVLQFPSTDDYGSPENWVVYKVWWGHRPLMAKEDVSGVAGVNQFNSMHPRKLFISGLSKIFTESDVDHRRAELERAFSKYAGQQGMVQVIVPTNSTYAFVEMETERLSEQALQEMAGTYRLNRARRSRHEALQEERALKEKGGKESTAATKEW